MLRTLPILLLILVLMACTISAQAKTLTLDGCLDDLAEKQSIGPVVAVMHGPVEGTADLSSLEGLARTFGLKLFDQDGIHVLGPAECIHLYDLAPYLPKEPPKGPVEVEGGFFHSLTPEQLRTAFSPHGLRFSDLSEKQQAQLRSIFAGDIYMTVDGDEPPPGSVEYRQEAEEDIPPSSEPSHAYNVPVSRVPIEQVSINASLGCHSLDIETADSEWCLDMQGDTPSDDSEAGLYIIPRLRSSSEPAPIPFGPNVLKPSQLEYERPELQKQAEFPLRTDLKQVIALAAEESGLPLVVGPGSEQVRLYVKAGSQSIGQVLKAVSLATTGTWRRVGDQFLYSLDVTGLGAFDRMASDLGELMRLTGNPSETPFNPTESIDLMSNYRVEGLTPEQIAAVLSSMARNPKYGACGFAWRMLTPEQQAAFLKQYGELRAQRLDQLFVRPDISLSLAFHFPRVGSEETGDGPARYSWSLDLMPRWDASMIQYRESDVYWPKGARIPMPTGIRGMLYKVSKSDTPASIIAPMARYGLNTLLVRIYADGYTIFPSKQFPSLPGLKTEDFLRNLIAVAHARGIKVIGVIDVLRWSNGAENHWLSKSPELIDRDIAGRTNTEWREQRAKTDYFEEPLYYGNAYDGDFVTPFHPLVRDKLSALVGELSTYDLDGLALAHTSVANLYVVWNGRSDAGQIGFHELSRLAFIRATGIDPVDITTTEAIRVLPPSPMIPIVSAASSSLDAWRRFNLAASYALADKLIEDWHEAKPGLPIWTVDSHLCPGNGRGEVMPGIDLNIGAICGRPGDQRDKTVELVTIDGGTDLEGTGRRIAGLQNKPFAGMPPAEDLQMPSSPMKDIVFDFACSDARKTEFLKLLETARPTPAKRK